MDEWTTTTWVTVAGLLLAVLAVVVLGVALARQRRSTRLLLEAAATEREAFEARLSALEAPVPAPVTGGPVEQFVITEMGAPGGDARALDEDAVATRIGGRLFADVVLRESVVKAASWTHGVRTALSAENRNRIRFEVKRETKRATRRRKADVKEALRQYYARQESEAGAAEALTVPGAVAGSAHVEEKN